MAAARGFELAIYEEIGLATKARPVLVILECLVADARAGRVTTIGVWSLDRLGRGFAASPASISSASWAAWAGGDEARQRMVSAGI